MICFFRSRRLLLATPLLGLLGCDVGHTCTLVGCLDGLNIQLDGKFETGKAYQLDISTITTTPEIVPFMRCSVARLTENNWDLRCNSAFPHSEVLGNRIQIRTTEFTKLKVVVSSSGMTLGEQTLDAGYTSKEINGPGCGVCTSALVSVTVP
jgi:hypothetical protein